MRAERAVTDFLWVAACVSAVERSVGSGSGSFRAASVEVAFLAERLCFANLALSFLEYCLSWPSNETKNRLSPLPLAVCLNSGWLPRYQLHHGDVQDAEPLFVVPDPCCLCCDR